MLSPHRKSYLSYYRAMIQQSEMPQPTRSFLVGGGSESRWPRHANKIPRIITRTRDAFDRGSRAPARYSRRPSPLTSGDVRQSFREATFHLIPRSIQRFSYRHSRLTALEKTLLAADRLNGGGGTRGRGAREREEEDGHARRSDSGVLGCLKSRQKSVRRFW